MIKFYYIGGGGSQNNQRLLCNAYNSISRNTNINVETKFNLAVDSITTGFDRMKKPKLFLQYCHV